MENKKTTPFGSKATLAIGVMLLSSSPVHNESLRTSATTMDSFSELSSSINDENIIITEVEHKELNSALNVCDFINDMDRFSKEIDPAINELIIDIF